MIDLAPLVGAAPGAVAAVHGGIHDAHRVDVDGRTVFVKSSATAPVGAFEAEAEGLRWLGEVAGGPPVPAVVSVVDDADAPRRGIVLEWLDSAPARPDADVVFGRRLAALHRAGSSRWGRDDQGFIGTVPLANADAASWVDYYAVQLDALIEATGLSEIGPVLDRLPLLLETSEPPSRLHGDLWGGNVMTGPDGHTWLVDPACYGGHREVDLAMMRLFGGFSDRVFAGYQEAWPLVDGWRDRVAVHQLLPLLVHAALFGGHYRAEAVAAARSCR